MAALENFVLLMGRILMALIFVRAGMNKLGGLDHTVTEMANHGIPFPHVLVWGAVAMELGAGCLLILGLAARWAALALFFYTLTLALIFHAYWTMPAAQAGSQASAFFEHLSIMGGMLAVFAFGGGALSLDALLRRQPPSGRQALTSAGRA
jgi:putative oxidoreductase